MKTLTALFSEERNQLQTEIDKATGVEQVVKLVQTRLDNLERIYISQLNVVQIRLASFFLDILQQSIATLAAANQAPVTVSESKSSIHTTIPPNQLILKLSQALICVGILGSLFSLTKTAPGAWMAILLTALLLGLEAVLQLDKNKQENQLVLVSPQQLKPSQPSLRVNSLILLDNLADALNTIDLAVARVEDWNKPLDDRGIEELPELLTFLQRLMGASFLDKPQMMSELTKLLPQVLMEQGIHAQIYRAQDPQSDRAYFDFEPSIDPSNPGYVTITPALLKGDRLLRRGRVIEPAPIEARE